MRSAADLIYGIHAVEAAIKHAPEDITVIYVQTERHDKRLMQIVNLAKSAKIKINHLSQTEMAKQFADFHHQGVVAKSIGKKQFHEQDLEHLIIDSQHPPLFLVLDGVQDPHNLGACLRSANAAGVNAVIAPKDRAASITPIVRKVASGAAEVTPFIAVTNLSRTLRQLRDQGVWVFGLAGEAEKILYKADLTVPAALVLGAEGEGMRRLTREHCDELLYIPMSGSVTSLNVSVAAGICLFEAVRQRDINKK